MPKSKGKSTREEVEASADLVDDSPNEWSDEEEDSSDSNDGQSLGTDAGILRDLIQHGFEVKGKMTEGKLQYIFRSPKPVKGDGAGEGRLQSSNTEPVYAGSSVGSIQSGQEVASIQSPPPDYYSHHSSRMRDSVPKRNKRGSISKKAITWVLT